MGLIDNIGASRSEKRAIGGVPWMPWTDPRMRFDVGGPLHPNRLVNFGEEKALGLPALYAGTKILADSAAQLPMHVYQRNRNGRLLPYNGPTIFDKPSVLGTRFDWLFTAMSSLVLQGNAWGLITGKDGFGLPKGIEWVPAEHVEVMPDEDQPFNPLRTKVFLQGREMKWFGPDKELFHIKAFSVAGHVEGLSPLKLFALTLASGMSAAEFGRTWFDAGGFPTGTFQNSEMEVDPADAAKIRGMLVSSLRRHEPLVFGRDWDYTPVTVPPAEAQFIDAMQINATQIAGILGVPPERIGGDKGSYTYSTQEQGALQIIESLAPWLARIEQSASDSLMPRNRVVKFNTDGLLRTDLQTRTQIYQIQREIGMLTIDEIRELEDREPLPDGAGTESIPLTMMASMAQRSGAFPTKLLPQVTFLMDLAADKLEELQKKGLTKTQPDQDFTPPGAPAPDPANPGAPVAKPDPNAPQAPAEGQNSVGAGPVASPAQFYAQAMNGYSRQLESQGNYAEASRCREIANQLMAAAEPVKYAGALTASKQVTEMLDDVIRESRSHEGKEWDVVD
jgi:HK97 family phage portal protein